MKETPSVLQCCLTMKYSVEFLPQLCNFCNFVIGCPDETLMRLSADSECSWAFTDKHKEKRSCFSLISFFALASCQVLLLTYKAPSGPAPSYLDRSQYLSKSTMGGRAISYQTSFLLNHLPVWVKEADTPLSSNTIKTFMLIKLKVGADSGLSWNIP